ncbi:MAG: SMI1/KNR4 family protein [Lachnospira sp.]|jgi:hypothetical protein|nr:SMI1/KNR4 family protein [Lachnospira sp.]
MNKNYKYLSDEHADYIKNLINKVAEKDKNYEIFGAKVHQYELNETVSLEWVRAFEKKYEVKLPQEYVFFITKVGNGGTGPYYGIEPLSLYEDYVRHYKHLSKPSIYNEDYLQFYNEHITLFENEKRYEEREDDEEAFHKKQEQIDNTLKNGTLNINNQGCTYNGLLVVNGRRAGEIVYIDWELDVGYPPVLVNMTFLEWYQGYFEAILAGYDIRGYGWNILGDEKELMAKYTNADLKTKSQILSSFFKFTYIDKETTQFKETIQFISNFDGVDDVCRLKLLFSLDYKQALQMFDTFLESDSKKIETAVEVCMDIWSEDNDKYYEKMLRFIYGDYGHFEDRLKETALIFIGRTKRLSAGDLFEFVKNKEHSEHIRRVAMYVIGEAEDVEDFIDTFIDILKNIDSEVVLLETLITLRGVKNEKIAQTYKALMPKYKKDTNPMIAKEIEYYLKYIE